MDTPGLLKDSDINVVYILMTAEHRQSPYMDIVVSLAKKNIGQFAFVTADLWGYCIIYGIVYYCMLIFSKKYGLKISDVQLPEKLEESPYIIIQPKSYVGVVYVVMIMWSSPTPLGSVGAC